VTARGFGGHFPSRRRKAPIARQLANGISRHVRQIWGKAVADERSLPEDDELWPALELFCYVESSQGSAGYLKCLRNNMHRRVHEDETAARTRYEHDESSGDCRRPLGRNGRMDTILGLARFVGGASVGGFRSGRHLRWWRELWRCGKLDLCGWHLLVFQLQAEWPSPVTSFSTGVCRIQ